MEMLEDGAGRAQRTLFVARYLRDRELQREITEGLNVVEAFSACGADYVPARDVCAVRAAMTILATPRPMPRVVSTATPTYSTQPANAAISSAGVGCSGSDPNGDGATNTADDHKATRDASARGTSVGQKRPNPMSRPWHTPAPMPRRRAGTRSHHQWMVESIRH